MLSVSHPGDGSTAATPGVKLSSRRNVSVEFHEKEVMGDQWPVSSPAHPLGLTRTLLVADCWPLVTWYWALGTGHKVGVRAGGR